MRRPCAQVVGTLALLADGALLHGTRTVHKPVHPVRPHARRYLNAKDGSEGVRPLGIVHRVRTHARTLLFAMQGGGCLIELGHHLVPALSAWQG